MLSARGFVRGCPCGAMTIWYRSGRSSRSSAARVLLVALFDHELDVELRARIVERVERRDELAGDGGFTMQRDDHGVVRQQIVRRLGPMLARAGGTLECRQQPQRDGGGDQRSGQRRRREVDPARSREGGEDDREQYCRADELRSADAASRAGLPVAAMEVAARHVRCLRRAGALDRLPQVRWRREVNANGARPAAKESQRFDAAPLRRADPRAVVARCDPGDDALRIMRARAGHERLVDERQAEPSRQRAIIGALADPALAQHHLFGRNPKRRADSRRRSRRSGGSPI